MRRDHRIVVLGLAATLLGAMGCSPPDDPLSSPSDANSPVPGSIFGPTRPHSVCVGEPTSCDDANPCTIDTCHPILGCLHRRKPTGAGCDDGETCTTNDECTAAATCVGTRVSCDDGNPCTLDQCVEDSGECENAVLESTNCDDGDACTADDVCSPDGICVGSEVSCDDGNPCTLDRCATDTGQCENATQESAPCDDGNSCTSEDICTAGAECLGVEASPDDGNECTADSCDSVSGVAHDPVPAGAPCSQGLGDNVAMVCDGQARCNVLPESESVVARIGGQDDTVEERRLGSGRHPVAASSEGFGVAFVEALHGGGARIGVATFSPGGAGLGLWRYDGVPYDADPVLAAVPGGYVVAFNALGIDGDGLGIAVVRLDGNGSALADPVAANTTTLFSEHSPDILWDGTSVVVAWEDDSMTESWERRMCTRKLTANLLPSGGEVCEWTAGANRSTASLAASSSGAAVAWREETTESASLQVRYSGLAWGIALDPIAGATEPAALVELDDSHLLTVYASGPGSQSALILSSAGIQSEPTLLNPLPSAARVEPVLAKTDDGVYLVWREPSLGPDVYLDEVWVQKAQWNGAALTWLGEPVSIPYPDPYRFGDQTKPAVASGSFVPSGALVAAWNDLTAGAGGPVHGDVLVSLLPTPIVRLEEPGM